MLTTDKIRMCEIENRLTQFHWALLSIKGNNNNIHNTYSIYTICVLYVCGALRCVHSARFMVFSIHVENMARFIQNFHSRSCTAEPTESTGASHRLTRIVSGTFAVAYLDNVPLGLCILYIRIWIVVYHTHGIIHHILNTHSTLEISALGQLNIP